MAKLFRSTLPQQLKKLCLPWFISGQLRMVHAGIDQEQYLDPFRDFFGPRGPQGPSQSSGSGVIINADGYIVTNNHVVQDADVVEVTLYDNRNYKAEVIGIDPDTDIAVD